MPVRRERKTRMKLRRLDPAEHGKTRRLWEEVFSDDTKAFLDYYYYIKTRDNAIYVIEEDGEICSMLQLNPYTVRVEGQEFPSAYIIAVATRKEYRSRGYMGALLRTSLKEMYSRGIPFTFLMPAAEAIYTPYDFRYIYSQDRGTLICGERDGGIYWKSEGDSPAHFEIQSEIKAAELGEDRRGAVLFSDAGLWDAEEMSHFFETYFADRFQVCTVRDAAYYQTMILEQQSERGGVRLIRWDGALKGFYAYAGEEGLEIREPLFLPGYENDFRMSVEELADRMQAGLQRDAEQQGDTGQKEGAGQQEIPVYACPPEYADRRKPLIMARIVSLRKLLSALKVPEEESVDCSFAVIDPLITENSRVWKLTSGIGETELHVGETEDSEGVLPAADLTELIFGRMAPEELSGREGVILTEHLIGELKKITKLSGACFNEIV